MEAISKQAQRRHLLARAGFGTTPAALNQARRRSIRHVVRQLLHDSASFEPLAPVDATTFRSRQSLKAQLKMGQLDRTELKAQLRQNAEQIRALNVQWLDRMAAGPGALREKMALFWHGHFACRAQGKNALFVQQYVNTLRRHALGRFPELLMAVSKEPAMLQFLNNQQNRKGAPNENFAREVMELFTLGKATPPGQPAYTETDIKEAARAFTGWQFTPDGQFVFREKLHDDGPKTIFGQTGAFRGEDVIELLLRNPQTAHYVAGKLYRFLVNDQPNPAHVAELGHRFFRSGYNIAELLETIFTADWFYDARHVGARIKAPVELLAGMRHELGVQFERPQPQIYVQRTLGQLLFYPPNVAGWPGGTSWIDSSSLLFRMKLPDYVLRAAEVTVRPKDEADVTAEALARKEGNQFKTTVNWADFERAFSDIAEADLPDALAAVLLPWPLTAEQRKLVAQRGGDVRQRSERIQRLTTAIMSLPEYQLC